MEILLALIASFSNIGIDKTSFNSDFIHKEKILKELDLPYPYEYQEEEDVFYPQAQTSLNPLLISYGLKGLGCASWVALAMLGSSIDSTDQVERKLKEKLDKNEPTAVHYQGKIYDTRKQENIDKLINKMLIDHEKFKNFNETMEKGALILCSLSFSF